MMDGSEFPVLFIGLPITLLGLLVASLFVGVGGHWLTTLLGALILVGGWAGNFYLVVKSHSLWMDRHMRR